MAARMEKTRHPGSAKRGWWRPWMVRPAFAWSALLIPLFLAVAFASAVPSATATVEVLVRLIGVAGGIFAALVVADDLRVHGERSAGRRRFWPVAVFLLFPLYPIYTHWRKTRVGRAASQQSTATGQSPATTQPPPPPPVPAGWYADPWRETRARYWNGVQWTGHTEGRLDPPPAEESQEGGP